MTYKSLIVSLLIASLSCTDATADPVTELVAALSKASLITTDRESLCLLDSQGTLTRFGSYGGSPLRCGFSDAGDKAYLFRRDIIEVDRARQVTRTITLPPEVSGNNFVVLPKMRFAILDNRDDVIHVIDSAGKLVKTVRMNLASDGHLQNVAGTVVGKQQGSPDNLF